EHCTVLDNPDFLSISLIAVALAISPTISLSLYPTDTLGKDTGFMVLFVAIRAFIYSSPNMEFGLLSSVFKSYLEMSISHISTSAKRALLRDRGYEYPLSK